MIDYSIAFLILTNFDEYLVSKAEYGIEEYLDFAALENGTSHSCVKLE